jgi:bifunctional UDP-N-acetylglucosamine pyrophosphorylase/glucosamine-1-phosphate N-acetyltransferase
MAIQIVILAAGLGKRMHSALPKVLHCLAGKPLLEHVIGTALSIAPSVSPLIVYGHEGEKVRDALSHYHTRWIEQKEQLGTGHAVLQTLSEIADEDQVLILYGDVPLISVSTLKNLMEATPAHALGLLSVHLNTPTGYGRIIRDEVQHIVGVIEEKDARPAERAITEVNSGIYWVPALYLKKWLPTLEPRNAQKEYYLTDIIALAAQEQIPIHAYHPLAVEEVMGVNDRAQLAHLERFYQRKYAESLLQQGVTLADPARLDIRGDVHIGKEVHLDINVILEGRVILGDGCVIGPHTILKNTVLGKHVEIKAYSLIDGAEIADHSVIGPFARLRPGTVLENEVHIGNFVEIKNSEIGAKTKINHLSYVGDSEVGKEVNIGAGTITCNYDGMNKHKTIIGDRVQVGSDSTLVAPLTIHEDAYVASATTVRKEVPAGALVFNTRDEQLREGWTAKHLKKIKK